MFKRSDIKISFFIAFCLSSPIVHGVSNQIVKHNTPKTVSGEFIPKNDFESPLKDLVIKSLSPYVDQYENDLNNMSRLENLLDKKTNGAYSRYIGIRKFKIGGKHRGFTEDQLEQIDDMLDEAWNQIKNTKLFQNIDKLTQKLLKTEDKALDLFMKNCRRNLPILPQLNKLMDLDYIESLFPKHFHSLYNQSVRTRELSEGWFDLMEESQKLKFQMVKVSEKVTSLAVVQSIEKGIKILPNVSRAVGVYQSIPYVGHAVSAITTLYSVCDVTAQCSAQIQKTLKKDADFIRNLKHGESVNFTSESTHPGFLTPISVSERQQ